MKTFLYILLSAIIIFCSLVATFATEPYAIIGLFVTVITTAVALYEIQRPVNYNNKNK